MIHPAIIEKSLQKVYRNKEEIFMNLFKRIILVVLCVSFLSLLFAQVQGSSTQDN